MGSAKTDETAQLVDFAVLWPISVRMFWAQSFVLNLCCFNIIEMLYMYWVVGLGNGAG